MIANQEYLDDEIEQPRIGFQDKAIQKVLLMRPLQMRRNVDAKRSGTKFCRKIKEYFGLSKKKSPKYPYNPKWWA